MGCMNNPSPARYRTTNWPSYTASLRKRGSLLIWLDKTMTWLAPRDGSLGRPEIFSDATIQLCLTVKVLFKLPLRQTAGTVTSLLKMADLGWAVPDCTALCRRHVWTAPDAQAGILTSLCRKQSCLRPVCAAWPLAQMKSANQFPIKITRSIWRLDPWGVLIPGSTPLSSFLSLDAFSCARLVPSPDRSGEDRGGDDGVPAA